MARNSSNEVLLIFPGRYGAPNPQVPLSLLYLAGSLMQNGYKARILDMRVENYRKASVGTPLFVGISCMSGLQISFGLEFARMMRELDPGCPIVWGGVHPTILPSQTVQNEHVDIVVRGEGEGTVVKLAERFGSGGGLEGIDGITYKVKGGQTASSPATITSAPDAPFVDLDATPVESPFELLRLEKYPSLRSGRFHMQTSRGCPHRCGFCYNTVFNKCRWRSKKPSRVLDEMEHAKKKFSGINCLDIIDDNYFVDRKRVEEICHGMIERGIDIPWRADCRFDYMSRYDREFLELLEKSGCKELNFGAETGSERLLLSIKKDVSPEQMMTSLRKMKEWAPGISSYIFWMSGFPTETREDLEDTFRLMDNLSGMNPKTQHIEICVYTPYPSPMLDMLPAEFRPPKTMEEWGREDVFHFRPPWHPKEYVDLLVNVSIVTRYAFFPEDRIKEFSPFYRVGYKAANKIAKYRWRHKNFSYPLELKIVSGLARKVRGY